jgi:hypothetical protein
MKQQSVLCFFESRFFGMAKLLLLTMEMTQRAKQVRRKLWRRLFGPLLFQCATFWTHDISLDILIIIYQYNAVPRATYALVRTETTEMLAQGWRAVRRPPKHGKVLYY